LLALRSARIIFVSATLRLAKNQRYDKCIDASLLLIKAREFVPVAADKNDVATQLRIPVEVELPRRQSLAGSTRFAGIDHAY